MYVLVRRRHLHHQLNFNANISLMSIQANTVYIIANHHNITDEDTKPLHIKPVKLLGFEKPYSVKIFLLTESLP